MKLTFFSPITIIGAAIIIQLYSPPFSFAEGSALWQTNGVPICVAANRQVLTQIVSDGDGGAIITWEDDRWGDDVDIYAQRVDSKGTVQWSADGVVICWPDGDQRHPMITSDGSGGAIITWEDDRNGATASDIYAQRIDHDGKVQWLEDGMPICTAIGSQADPRIAPDAWGGAIITWGDSREMPSGGDYLDIFAQRIDHDGYVGPDMLMTPNHWVAQGSAVCTATMYQSQQEIITDGAGGAIIVWQDSRSGTRDDIYAQRMEFSGAPQWGLDGVLISGGHDAQHPNDTSWPQLASDGNGGAIIAWQNSSHVDISDDIYTQRVDALGHPQWTPGGVVICSAGGQQETPKIASDGSGGAIICWEDERSGEAGTGYDIYAQGVNSGGYVRWTVNGVAVCTAPRDQKTSLGYGGIAPDGSGGAIITWHDLRSGTAWHIYTQKIDHGGATQWTPDGLAVCTSDHGQGDPQIISDGQGGAIITWDDVRGSNFDIFAQRVGPSPKAQILLNASYGAGDRLTAMFKLNEAIAQQFTAYAAIMLPDGKTMLDMMTLSPKIKPVATKIPGLPADFSCQLLSVTVPATAPKGVYELLVGFTDPSGFFLIVRNTFIIR